MSQKMEKQLQSLRLDFSHHQLFKEVYKQGSY